ncbi:MAG: hypothetical protein AAFP19_00545 [Bacteroidota bacterium]
MPNPSIHQTAMLNSKLITLLQNLDRTQWTRLGKFIQSPFFNESQELIRLFELLDNHFKTHKEKQLSKTLIWNHLFPNRSYKDDFFRRICSDLTKQIEHFLAYSIFTEDHLTEQITLLDALNRPQLNKHFVGTVRQIRAKQEKSKLQNANYHFIRFKTEQSCHRHIELSGIKRNNFENLENADYSLDCYYISQKLKNYCDTLGYKNFLSTESNIALPPNFMEFVKTSVYFKEPSIRAYFLIYQMFSQPEEESYFQELKQYLEAFGDSFTKKELYSLYIHLNNYCIDTKINRGRFEYFNELFDVFKVLLNKEILFHNGLLLPQDYKNIITVALHVRAFDWVEQFIQNYTARMPKANQENALTYNLAKVYFHKGAYDKVIEQLREVEYKSLVYALGGKLMLLKTYYELGEDSALDSLIDSFRAYLRRNKLISRAVRQQYLNVLRFVNKLATLPPRDSESLEKIKQQVHACKALAAKNWILEKVGELEKR